MTHSLNIEEIEERILEIFFQFNIRPNESLPVKSIFSVWSKTRFNNNELADGLSSLINKGYLEDTGKSSFRLTEKAKAKSSAVFEADRHYKKEISPPADSIKQLGYLSLLRSFLNKNKIFFYIIFGLFGIYAIFRPTFKENLINSDPSAYKSPGPAAFSSDINPYLHIEKKEKPFIIREWDDTWGFNVSSYDCLYAWPNTEKHSSSDNSFDYFQSKTWSIHPKTSSKAAGIAFVLLSTEKVVVKKILLHLSNFKAAPNLKQFKFVKISEVCGGTGGSSTPRIIFKPILLTPDKKTYYPKIFKAPDAEGDYVTSLPYQMELDESLSFGFNFYGGSGDYEVVAEIMATDFSGRDYNVTTPAVRFKRLIVKEKDLAAISILKEVEAE